MKKKCLIYVVSYNHEKFILDTLLRIPKSISKKYNVEILVSNDRSQDKTLEQAKKFKPLKFKYNIICHNKNLGYGGNQKIGYYYSIKKNFDYVVLLHGDGQYAPEYLPKILNEFESKKNYSAVFGSRMMLAGSAIKGGMPLYKFVGNKILTFIQNFLLNSKLSEFHSGYRAYRVNSLKKIFYQKNANDYCFDTQIIIQFLLNNMKIKEIPIPTFYGEEISYVNGLKYATQIIIETILAKLFLKKILFSDKYLKINKIKKKKIYYQDEKIKKTISKSKFYKFN